MTLAQLQRQRLADGLTDGPAGGRLRLNEPETEGPSFGDTLSDAVQSVDRAQKSADANIEAFVAGEQEDLHEVMISMNQAQLQFQLMTEVRNRVLETYQELMRMQV